VFADRGPIGLPVVVSAGDAQGEHIFGMFHAPPSSGPLQALLRDIAMRAFDLTGADRQILGQGVPIVQLIAAIAQIAMTSPHRRLFFVHVGGFAVARQLLQHVRRTPCFERVLLSPIQASRAAAFGAIPSAAVLKYSQT